MEFGFWNCMNFKKYFRVCSFYYERKMGYNWFNYGRKVGIVIVF